MNFPRKHGAGVVHKKEEAKKSLLFHRAGMIALALGGVKKACVFAANGIYYKYILFEVHDGDCKNFHERP